MEVKLVVGNKSVALGFSAIENLVGELNGCDAMAVIEELGRHSSSAVRAAIARRDDLPENLVHQFASDPSAAVNLAVLASEAGKQYLTTEEILAIYAKSEEAAKDSCWRIEGYREADIGVLAGELSRHPDPGVRMALATNTSVPRKFLKILSSDDDPSVAGAALESMRQY